jgi:hypothetical protein
MAGKWVVQHYFTSAQWPDINDPSLEEYGNLESALGAYKDAANETEYGFRIVQDEPLISGGSTVYDAEHTEETLRRVYGALHTEGIYGQKAVDVVNAIHNNGVLFRDRS